MEVPCLPVIGGCAVTLLLTLLLPLLCVYAVLARSCAALKVQYKAVVSQRYEALQGQCTADAVYLPITCGWRMACLALVMFWPFLCLLAGANGLWSFMKAAWQGFAAAVLWDTPWKGTEFFRRGRAHVSSAGEKIYLHCSEALGGNKPKRVKIFRRQLSWAYVCVSWTARACVWLLMLFAVYFSTAAAVSTQQSLTASIASSRLAVLSPLVPALPCPTTHLMAAGLQHYAAAQSFCGCWWGPA